LLRTARHAAISAILGMIAAPARAEGPAPIVLRDVTAESGVAFRFETGTRGRHDLPEIMGGGIGLIDCDGDGRLDLYLCNGGPIDPRPAPDGSPCRLFRNEGPFRFREITGPAGAPGPGYAMGCAVGDYDDDGRDDLFVTGWRDQRLYRNLGGRFQDVTERAGLRDDRWSTSAAFTDLDADGDLDLYVASYVAFDPERAPFCAAPDGRRDYCGPEDFPAQPDRLYRNNGDGTFTDFGEASGIAGVPPGRGLGVLIANLAGDHRPDIFVANDGSPGHLFENLGGFAFREIGHEAGVALDGRGEALAGMGVGLADLDGDGRPDLVVSNFHGRGTVAFGSLGQGRYRDISRALGLTAATRDVLGFGLATTDLDGDGRPDLFQANGHVLDRARLGVPFTMRPTLLRNENGRLVDVAATAGDWLTRPMLDRGVAAGDLDHDGRPDLVVNALDAPAAVLRNESSGNHWLAIELQGAGQGIGATVRVTAGGRETVHVLAGGGSYLAASSRTLHVGLDRAETADRVEVVWPSGRVEVWRDLRGPAARLIEGKGTTSFRGSVLYPLPPG
jgi:hypothetical protein